MYSVLGSVVFVVVMRSCVLFRSGARTARRQPASCSRGGKGGGGGCCRGVLGVVLVVFADSCGMASLCAQCFLWGCSYMLFLGVCCRTTMPVTTVQEAAPTDMRCVNSMIIILSIILYKGQSGRDVLVLWGVCISGLFRLWDGLNE